MSTVYYFDNNATTRIAPEVLEAMMPFLTQDWGNPSSGYRFGRQSANHVDLARERVAALIKAEPTEVVFTSCGTESNNTAIHSALASQPDKRHVLTTAVEHSSNAKYCEYLVKTGYEVTELPVSEEGLLDLGLLERSIRPDTAVVSVMWANNETGVLFPIPEIGAICRQKGTLFHTDAVQAAGKIAIDVRAAGVDFLTLSAHKLYAPKGVGALYVKHRTDFVPYLVGGEQERGRRGGTENVAGIVAFGRAAQLAIATLGLETTRVRAFRDRLEAGILRSVPDTLRNGAEEPRLPNTSNIGFSGVEAEAVLIALDQLGICAASGSACTTGSLQPSRVLRAMGKSVEQARGSLRFSLGIYNTEEEIQFLLGQLPTAIKRLRLLASLSPPFKRTHRG